MILFQPKIRGGRMITKAKSFPETLIIFMYKALAKTESCDL
jgi:hypothetical protein